jgi:putative peptidoglycan binding protein
VSWIVAESLNRLLTQLSAYAPNRSRASDGSIGDASHQAKGSASDHNPRWIARANLVTARDFTHDPAGGLDCNRLRDSLMRARDSRIKYMIFNREIISGAGGPRSWVRRPYSGPSPHTEHLHLSVVADARARDASPWMLPGLVGDAPTPPNSNHPTIQRGSTGDAVKLIQRFLGVVGPGDAGYGVFGPATEAAVKAYQKMRGLVSDGICGPATWRETGL